MTFSKSILKKITTNDTKRPTSPQVKIDNPLDKDTIVNGIELILSPEFTKKGKLLIRINDVAVFDENDSEAFFGYAKYPIPLNKTLVRSNDIQIFAWNGSGDTNTIEVSLNVFISENVEPFSSQAVPLGQDVFNAVVSQDEQVIAQDDYLDQTITKLIDMAGYKKLVLLIAGSSALSLTTHADPDSFVGPDSGVDKNFSSFATKGISVDNDTVSITYKFAEALDRALGLKIGGSITLGTATDVDMIFSIYTSPDDITYTLRHTKTFNNPADGSSFDDTFSVNIGESYEYVRLDIQRVNNSGGTISLFSARIFEVYDFERIGGTAALSFEVFNRNNNTWQELISASSIGTITEGQEVTKQIGDVVNDLSSDKFNVVLPSTQTDFRAKLVVTGNLNTGVSILKV